MRPDYFGAPPDARINQQIYRNAGAPWAQWIKPSGVSMISMLVIGAGGGGGGGFTGITGTARGGGGGGGSSAISTLLIPALFLPDALYVQVPSGGAGGAIGGAGGGGNQAYVCIQPNFGVPICIAGQNAAGGGSAGAAALGTAGGVADIGPAAPFMGRMGIFQTINGQTGGVSGQPGGAGAPLSVSQHIPIAGGGGGSDATVANASFQGSQQTGAGIYPTIFGTPAAPTPGNGGYLFEGSGGWVSYGGCGGPSDAAGTAGAGGGAGGPGSGGGGGGGGITGARGGKGGDGLVVITSW